MDAARPSPLDRLLNLRSKLTKEVIAYLDSVIEQTSRLPEEYFPPHLRDRTNGAPGFEAIQQQVTVIEDRTRLDRWTAEKNERLRAAGHFDAHLAYSPNRSRPERDDVGDWQRDRPSPFPRTVPWDRDAADRFPRAVILGDPGMGKSWFLRIEARRLAQEAKAQIEARTKRIDEVFVPILAQLPKLNLSNGDLVAAIVQGIGKSDTPRQTPPGRYRANRRRRSPGVGRTGAVRRRVLGEPAPSVAGFLLSADDPATHVAGPPSPGDPPLPGSNQVVFGEKCRKSHSFRNWLRSRLKTDRAVVLLDAWDEVRVEIPATGQPLAYKPHRQQRLGERIKLFAENYKNCRILMTSRIVGYMGSPFPNARELELDAFDQPEIEQFARVWFSDGEADQFLGMLKSKLPVRGLARIPLMLTLMCRVYMNDPSNFPASRAGLYERCIKGLLHDWKGGKQEREVEDRSNEIELLSDVALDLFERNLQQFSERDLTDAVLSSPLAERLEIKKIRKARKGELCVKIEVRP